jgi:hypothetical protein
MGTMSTTDPAPLPRLGEVFFDVRSKARSLRISWYSDTGVAVLSIWQGGTCTGSFRLPMGDLPRLIGTLQAGPPSWDMPGGPPAPDAPGSVHYLPGPTVPPYGQDSYPPAAAAPAAAPAYPAAAGPYPAGQAAVSGGYPGPGGDPYPALPQFPGRPAPLTSPAYPDRSSYPDSPACPGGPAYQSSPGSLQTPGYAGGPGYPPAPGYPAAVAASFPRHAAPPGPQPGWPGQPPESQPASQSPHGAHSGGWDHPQAVPVPAASGALPDSHPYAAQDGIHERRDDPLTAPGPFD